MTASMKMIVSEASRTLSATSLGVFCRDAPSTRLIIRSMNVSPGLEVILTTIRSDSTLVPPVTADRSPPDSRITGADSPVIADSSTDATPSTTSPSPGMVSPASTTTWSPRVSWVPGTSSSRVSVWPGFQSISRRATVSRLVRRSVSAWALPRPSATASARLAKITVSHKKMTIVQLKAGCLSSKIAVYVVIAAPTSTTNMTGLRNWTRGSSFSTAAGSEFHRIFGSSRPPPTRRGSVLAGSPAPGPVCGVVVTAMSVQSFCEWSQRERGEVGEADEDQDHADDHPHKQRSPGVQRARARGHRSLPGQRPGEAEREDLRREPAEQHHHPAEGLVPGGRGAQAGERGAVVVGFRHERVHDLGQAVRARVEDRRLALLGRDRQPGRGEGDYGDGQEVQRRVLHLCGPDLLADVLRCPADHQPGHEHSDDGQDEDAVHAGADSARGDLAQRHVEERDAPAERGERVVEAVHRAGGGQRRRRREHRAGGCAEPDLGALRGVARGDRRRAAGGGVRLEEAEPGDRDDPDDRHDRDDRVALLVVLDHLAERPRRGERDQ